MAWKAGLHTVSEGGGERGDLMDDLRTCVCICTAAMVYASK